MSKATSPYYPPRARWYASVFYLFGAVRRNIGLERIHLPPSITWPGLAACFLIPGFGFYLRGPRILGRAMMGVCALLFTIFIVWLGYPIANIACGLMVSTHVSGIAYYCDSFLRQWELQWRILFTVLALMAVGFLFYAPLRQAIQNHLLMPLRMGNRVVILVKSGTADKIQRGDWVGYMMPGYRFSNHMGNGILDDKTMGFGPVLAIGGDNVQFSTNSFSVNGVAHPPLPHMPQSGSLVVAQNYWFIWPILKQSGNWHPGEKELSDAMLELAAVPESQLTGKPPVHWRPLKYWFWRKQTWQ
jgi:hypothetical protein